AGVVALVEAVAAADAAGTALSWTVRLKLSGSLQPPPPPPPDELDAPLSVEDWSETPSTSLNARRRSMTVATASCDGVQPESVIVGPAGDEPSLLPAEPLKFVSVVSAGRARAT